MPTLVPFLGFLFRMDVLKELYLDLQGVCSVLRPFLYLNLVRDVLHHIIPYVLGYGVLGAVLALGILRRRWQRGYFVIPPLLFNFSTCSMHFVLLVVIGPTYPLTAGLVRAVERGQLVRALMTFLGLLAMNLMPGVWRVICPGLYAAESSNPGWFTGLLDVFGESRESSSSALAPYSGAVTVWQAMPVGTSLVVGAVGVVSVGLLAYKWIEAVRLPMELFRRILDSKYVDELCL